LDGRAGHQVVPSIVHQPIVHSLIQFCFPMSSPISFSYTSYSFPFRASFREALRASIFRARHDNSHAERLGLNRADSFSVVLFRSRLKNRLGNAEQAGEQANLIFWDLFRSLSITPKSAREGSMRRPTDVPTAAPTASSSAISESRRNGTRVFLVVASVTAFPVFASRNS
jgi:hypothetical protein